MSEKIFYPTTGGLADVTHEGVERCRAEKRLQWPKPEAVPGQAEPGAFLKSLTSEERKQVAMFTGLMAYFPDALALIARHSKRSNEKHNPGEPLHWARGKSDDQEECVMRHTAAVACDPESQDQGQYEIVSRGWRALAALQDWAEKMMAKHGRID